MPDHRNVHNPSWQRAWARFTHVTTPLRERGWICDVQFGLDDWLVYAWPPGHDSVLIVSREDGWLVTHQAPAQDWSSMTVVYDSRPATGPEDLRCVGPLLVAVDDRLARILSTPSAPAPAHAPPVTRQKGDHLGNVGTTPVRQRLGSRPRRSPR
ncbi:hypothetical protein ACIQZO_19295 [Streptomyces sp. NPDC097617]|uniref:hypothetical protein n=1 Tax=Streptomyces sp. NPDC097617 TaxID=3366091 RepID=UPI00381D6155